MLVTSELVTGTHLSYFLFDGTCQHGQGCAESDTVMVHMRARCLLRQHKHSKRRIDTKVAVCLHGAPGTYSIALRGGWWCMAAVAMLLVWFTTKLHASTHLEHVNEHSDVIMVCK